MKRLPLAITLAASLLLTACSGVPVNFSARSVSDRAQVDLSKGERISAEATSFQMLLFIPLSVNVRHETAYQALLEQAGDRMLSDIQVTESWKYGFVGTHYITTISAMAYPRVAK